MPVRSRTYWGEIQNFLSGSGEADDAGGSDEVGDTGGEGEADGAGGEGEANGGDTGADVTAAGSLRGVPTVTSPGFAAAQVPRPCASQATVLCGEEANAAWMFLITMPCTAPFLSMLK